MGEKYLGYKNKAVVVRLSTSYSRTDVFLTIVMRMDPHLSLSCFVLAIIVLHTAAIFSSRNESDRELIFGVIVGDKGNEGVLSGIQAALDEINGKNDLLPGYKLKYDLAHSEVCMHFIVIQTFPKIR